MKNPLEKLSTAELLKMISTGNAATAFEAQEEIRRRRLEPPRLEVQSPYFGVRTGILRKIQQQRNLTEVLRFGAMREEAMRIPLRKFQQPWLTPLRTNTLRQLALE